MKKEKKGKGALIISIVIFIICIGFCYYKNNNEVAPTKIINRNNRDINEEVAITDYSIKKDLSNKIDYLLYGREIKEDYISLTDLRRGEKSNIGDIFNDFNNTTRLRIVLDYNNYSSKFSPQKNKVTGIEDVDAAIRFIGLDTVKQISAKEIEKSYKLLFGEIDYIPENIKGCIGYYYDESKDLFYVLDSTCGGTSNTYVYVYKTNYMKHDNSAYVDVYFGYVKQEGDNYIAYKDYELTDNLDIDDFKLGNKLLSEDNYNEFEHYRFNFKLDNSNNYYFTEITK